MSTAQWRIDHADLVRKYKSDWYQRNKASEKIGAYDRVKLCRERNTQIVRDAKAAPCTDCGIQYPTYVMQFDHTKDDKDRGISVLAHRPVSVARLRTEIAKCELVCANCHFERTFSRLRNLGA